LLKETGRFAAPFRGLPGKAPTGKGYEIIAIEWFEFSDRSRLLATSNVEVGMSATAGIPKIMRRWAARHSAAITRQVCE
jgi:hypothetical protein